MIVTRGGDVEGCRAAQRLHERHELPCLLFVELAAKGGHAVRTPLEDGGKDVLRCASVETFVIHQRRPDVPAAVPIAARAVVPIEEPLAVAYALRVAQVRSGRLRPCWSRAW